MILVTLGTQDKQFTRLLKMVDDAITNGVIKDKVVVQAGSTKYESNNMEIFDYLSGEDFNKLIDEANIVITHGGVGTIIDAVNKGKVVIATPRLSKYMEHHNDHQKQIIKEFASKGHILELINFDDLEKVLKKAKTFKPKPYKSNTSNMVDMISNYIDENEKKKKKTLKDLLFKYHEVLLYLIFGVLTTVVNLIIYYLLVLTVLNPEVNIELQIANVVSWIGAVAFAYATNSTFVFNSNKEGKEKVKEMVSFTSSRVTTLVLDMVIMYIGVSYLKYSDKLVKLVSQVLVIVFNYVLSKLFVFKKK